MFGSCQTCGEWGEDLSAVAADLGLSLDRVVYTARDGDVRADLEGHIRTRAYRQKAASEHGV